MGFNPINVLATQGANLVGAKLPGYNAPTPIPQTSQAQINAARFANGNVSNWGPGAGGANQPTPTSSTPDPYAAYGGQANYNAQLASADSQLQNSLKSASDSADAQGLTYYSGIQDFLEQQRQGQNKIDSAAVQNELSKQQGTQGVLAAVGRGIKSGGVLLANKNASDSSAAEGIANAYGQFGRQQLSGVGNQYAQGMNAVAAQQSDLDLQRSQGVRHLGENKTSIVNGIVADTTAKLAQLDAQIAGANLPNRIALDQEKQQVRADALGRLQYYDQFLTQGLGGIAPSSGDARRVQANQLAQAGQAPENAFSFTSQAPAQFQNTGPSAAPLPLFSLPKGKDLAAPPA